MTESSVTPLITSADLLNEVPGGADLLRWFEGRVPSFHDAEIISLNLDRENASGVVRIRTFEMTREVDAQGYFVLRKHVIVSFRLSDITELELYDFNHQNVVDGLILSCADSGGFKLQLEPCYGLFGFMVALTVRIDIQPVEDNEQLVAARPTQG